MVNLQGEKKEEKKKRAKKGGGDVNLQGKLKEDSLF